MSNKGANVNDLNRIKQELKDMFTQYWRYLAVNAACKLSIFDAIKNGYNTLEKLCNKLGTDKEATHYLLKFLDQDNYIKFNKDDEISLTEKGELLLSDHPSLLKYACMIWSEEKMDCWQNLIHTLKTGNPALPLVTGSGTSLFEYIAKKGKSSEFHKGLTAYALDDYANVHKLYDWSQFRTIMDVGGGVGILISNIADHFPQAQCILLEKEEVIDLAKKEFFNPKLKYVQGNFFEKIPIHADCIIMARVIHDWDDIKAAKILNNVYNALNDNGTVVLFELLPDKLPDEAALLSLHMMCVMGSRERTLSEYRQLLASNGFSLIEVKPTNALQYMIIAKKSEQ